MTLFPHHIAQVLHQGTVAHNLDPFGLRKEETLRDAVRRSQLPVEMAMNVTESEAQALVHMLGGQDLLLSSTGQKPKPHYLQLSADFSVLRWSWKGYVLMNEVAGLQLSRPARITIDGTPHLKVKL